MKSLYLSFLQEEMRFKCLSFNHLLNSLCSLIFLSVKCLEEMKNQWDLFGSQYEIFSIWISDKEKQLEVLKSSALPLEKLLITVKVQYCVFKCCWENSLEIIQTITYYHSK